MSKILCLLLVFSFQTISALESNTSAPSFEQYYKEGVSAYLDERWQDCITDMETAIHLYKLALTAIADCRIKCQNEPFEPLVKKDIEDLHFYEKMVKRTLCFLKCKRTRYPNVVFEFPFDMEPIKIMENLTPYTYLHICYFHKNLLQKAASAAFTYLVGHPDDKTMRSNLEYYLTLPEVDSHEITNYEFEEFLPLYLHGMNSYKNEDWESVIAYMEESLHAYFASEQRCRVLCEGSFDQGWFPDFTSSISNHFTFCLKCKKHCAEKLKMLNYMKGKEILADQYNYLQISYHKLGRTAEACRCVASYLLIYPSDETMLQNKDLYSIYAEPDAFTPRPEIVHYLLREEYEDKLLQFINESFIAELNLGKLKVEEIPLVEDSVNEAKKTALDKDSVNEVNDIPLEKDSVNEANEFSSEEEGVNEANKIPLEEVHVDEANEIPSEEDRVDEANEIPSEEDSVDDVPNDL